MESRLEREPDHVRLHRQLRGSFATIYLTMLSIIQGVALADLAVVVGGGYTQFTLIQWLMIPMNFFTIISIWNHFMADSISMEWIPSFSDALLPFTFGAIELYLNHALAIGLPAWLAGIAILAGMEAVGTWFMDRKASHETQDHRLLQLFRSRVAGYMRQGVSGFIVFGLLLLATHLAHAEVTSPGHDTAQGALAIGDLAAVFIWGAIGTRQLIRYWHDIITYARTGKLPPHINVVILVDLEAQQSGSTGSRAGSE